MITYVTPSAPKNILGYWAKFKSSSIIPNSTEFIKNSMNDDHISIEYFKDIFNKFNIDLDLDSLTEYNELLNSFLELNSRSIYSTQILDLSKIKDGEENKKISASIIMTNLNVKENPTNHDLDKKPMYDIFIQIENSNNGLFFNMDMINYPQTEDGVEQIVMPIAFSVGSDGIIQSLLSPDEKLVEKLNILQKNIDLYSETNACFKEMKNFVDGATEFYTEYGTIVSPHLKLMNLIFSASENYKL